MLKYLEPLDWLPTAEDLPDCDSTPVDSELQEFIPTFLKTLLIDIWANRADWFFGIDMGIYYSPDEPPVVPDGFLSVGVDRIKSENLRLSYVLWEEQVLPQLVVEIVSKKYRGEYSTKKTLYENLGILYYVVYNPRRKRKPSLEAYKLIQGKYVQMVGNPIWLPELAIGIGKERFDYQGYDREWMFWYNRTNQRYPTAQEQVRQAQTQAQEAQTQAQEAQTQAQEAQTQAQKAQTQAEQAEAQVQQAEAQVQQAEARSQRLADRLRALGLDPDE
jgi:Uma2 family endonuclease